MIIKSSNNKLQRPDIASAGRITQKDQNNSNSVRHGVYSTPQKNPEVQFESTFTRPQASEAILQHASGRQSQTINNSSKDPNAEIDKLA